MSTCSTQWKVARIYCLMNCVLVCDSFAEMISSGKHNFTSECSCVCVAKPFVWSHSWRSQQQPSPNAFEYNVCVCAFLCMSFKWIKEKILPNFDSHDLKWMLFTNLPAHSSFHSHKVSDDNPKKTNRNGAVAAGARLMFRPFTSAPFPFFSSTLTTIPANRIQQHK